MCTKPSSPLSMYHQLSGDIEMNGYFVGSGPLGSDPSSPGSGFSVMPKLNCFHLTKGLSGALFG